MKPTIIGLANVVVPGSGYLLIRRRMVFGALMTVGSLITDVWFFIYPGTLTPGFVGPLELNSLLGITAMVCIYAAFFCDAYLEASR